MARRSSLLSLADMDVLTARDSLREIRRASASSYWDLNETDSEKSWNLTYLREQFELNKNLGELFNTYTQRISNGYFSVFLLLQTVLGITHFCLVAFPYNEVADLIVVMPDLICYGALAILSIFVFSIKENYIIQRSKLLRYLCFSALLLLLFVNLFVPIYFFIYKSYHPNDSQNLRPAYTTHIIIACHVFFNLHTNSIAIAAALLVTVLHLITTGLVTYGGDLLWWRLASDFIYLACVNGMGIYFRFINEVVIRRTFLDRRIYVESTLKLEYEKEQEEQLMLSIIPKQLIHEVRDDISKTIQSMEKSDGYLIQKPFENPYIKWHDNVTILYADIVNFTEMTTKLQPVTKLVETLNELFGRFDDASEAHNVLRIKFLGDCYYCVSGLSEIESLNHAESCVDLGLEMVKIIRKVRARRNLDIDMRIGVHSGQIFSGLIGLTKWQYDIWSKDVHIANRMETKGEPGKVHVTGQTKDLLEKPYNIVPSVAGLLDPMLKQYNIKTYLISSPENTKSSTLPKQHKKLSVIGENKRFEEDSIPHGSMPSTSGNGEINNNSTNDGEIFIIQNYLKSGRRDSLNQPIARRISGNPNLQKRSITTDYQRRTAFMDNNINRFNEHLRNTDSTLKKEIEKMPLSKFDQWFKMKEIDPFLITYRNFKMEMEFLKLPDPLFKYYLITVVAMVVSIGLIQNFTILPNWNFMLWLIYGTLAFLIFILLPIAWTHFLWTKYYYKNVYVEEQIINTFEPKLKPIRLLYKASYFVSKNTVLRIFVFLLTCGLVGSCVFVEINNCSHRVESNGSSNIRGFHFFKFTSTAGAAPEMKPCALPWHTTQTCCLAIITCFLFLRVHIWLKLFVALGITIYYSYWIWNLSDGFENYETYNYKMEARVAHTMAVTVLTFMLHLIDRQTNYMNRLDHQWNNKLQSERVEANIKHKINTMLLKNILPMHVAELYMNVNRPSGDLYHEEYKNVAVMFASIVDYSVENISELNSLAIMNQIIIDFDKLLMGKSGRAIEKIKIINWTYMAACGLQPGRRDSSLAFGGFRRKSAENVTIAMVRFAIQLFAALNKINREAQQDFKLRVGISHGEVTAGVVGSKKPLYDIWGDPVNMASRMDTTGEPGKIQVTKNTALVLQQQGIKCVFRGEIYVKPRPNVPTYFVDLDKNFRLTL